MHTHYEERDVASHIVHKKVEGVLAHSEAHGIEIPGHLSAATDGAREIALLLTLLWLILTLFSFPLDSIQTLLFSFSLGLVFWKTGRSAWLGWSRLERLHRLIDQERFEVINNRQQEKEELAAMYRLKGFEGKLLEDVVEVLTADQDRLLKVMLEEELGLCLEAHQHPLKQAFGAFIGTFLSASIALFCLFFCPHFGLPIGAILLIVSASLITAKIEKNKALSTIVWNLSLASLTLGIIYFLLQHLNRN